MSLHFRKANPDAAPGLRHLAFSFLIGGGAIVARFCCRPETRTTLSGNSAGKIYFGALLAVALLALTGGYDGSRAQNPTVCPSPVLRSAICSPPSIAGPGYQDANIAQAFQIENRRGHDPFRRQAMRPQGQAMRTSQMVTSAGNTNYLLTVPLINLPGRGLDVALTLYYNSQMWTQQSSVDMVFDHDADWPAPGWSLSFGKVIQVGSGRGVLQEPDGTLHPFTGTLSGASGNVISTFIGHTTDGSLIDYTIKYLQGSGTNNVVLQATAQYPNGKTVTYGACRNYICYATQITDANGNFLSISYVGDAGPGIQQVIDTLGRVILFNYDSTNRLVSITVPRSTGYEAVARMHYATQWIPGSGFSPSFHVYVPNGPVPVIDGLYFPATSTGYWFGDSDSYSSFGMISKISQQRGMKLAATSVYDQGILWRGGVSRESLYDYPSSPTTLDGPPTFTKMTETWAGMEVPLAVTTYAVNSNASPRTSDTLYPDGTRVSELRYNHPGQFDDGLLYSQITHDPSGKRLREIDNKFSLEDYDSPCVKSVTVTDELGQSATTVYDYHYDNTQVHSTNQLEHVTELGYDGTTVLRQTRLYYELPPGYTVRHIFNLPTAVAIQDGNGNTVAHTFYGYDEQPLANTLGVLGWTDPATQQRGNITSIVRVKGFTGVGVDWVTENLRYDATGNMIEVSGPCCVDMVLKYTATTQYAYPEKTARGAADPNSAACLNTGSCVSQSITYDLQTGRPLTTTDANGLTTSTGYDAASLRVQSVKSPTSATVNYQYDDLGMSTTQTVSDAAGAVASKITTQLNGLGVTASVSSLAGANTNVVSLSYDARGRLWRRSQPHLLGQQPTFWTAFTYDSLGRVTAIQNPDGSRNLAVPDETNRPSSASGAPGQTMRHVDEVGRERWSRTDALGRLVEVVEPAADGNGSVFGQGNVQTAYSYNLLGLLTHAVQGPIRQERDFQYDLLGRLTNEYLPEKGRTLDANGKYVGANGQWSDVFSYDDRSNLVWHMDARGMKTVYDFRNDPLNRLFSVSYETPGSVDTSSPIPTTRTTDYQYVPAGDVTRLAGIELRGEDGYAAEQYGYDPQGRLSTKTLLYPLQDPLVLNYNYDSLNRLSEEIYPAESGTPSQARKTVDFTYGVGGLLTDLKVDGADYASGFVYNPAGQATWINIGPAGAQQTGEGYSYDPATGLLASQFVDASNAKFHLLNLAYMYFLSRQLKQVTERNETLSYDYDALARLFDVKATGTNTWSESYAYDIYGNRISVTATGKGPDGSPIPLDGLAGSPTPPNGLSALYYDQKSNHVAQPWGFAYDAAGNQVRAQRLDGSWVRYQYDQAGRLAQVTDDNGRLLERYLYWPDGRRLQKADATTTTPSFWDGSEVIAEYTLQNTGTKWSWSKGHLYLGGRILATFVPENSAGHFAERVYYHHPDRLGVRLITNGTDDTYSEQVTLPFGTLLPSGQGNPLNPIFTSYDRSSLTGLDYAINRHYDPLERFTQVDPAGMAAVRLSVPQSLNQYAYVENDPIMHVDPIGLSIICHDNGNGTQTCTYQDGAGYEWTQDITGRPSVSEEITVVGQRPSASDAGVGILAGPSSGSSGGRGETERMDKQTKATCAGSLSLQEAIYRGLGGTGPFVSGPRPTTDLDKLAIGMLAAPVVAAGAAVTAEMIAAIGTSEIAISAAVGVLNTINRVPWLRVVPAYLVPKFTSMMGGNPSLGGSPAALQENLRNMGFSPGEITAVQLSPVIRPIIMQGSLSCGGP